jgi:hypothetical protein
MGEKAPNIETDQHAQQAKTSMGVSEAGEVDKDHMFGDKVRPFPDTLLFFFPSSLQLLC